MIRIGIELNGIVRDINKQYLKYYVKDINPEYDDTNIDLNVVDFIKDLKFESEEAKRKFIYEDYPYELFGCAAPMERNLHTFINGWVHDLYWDEDIEISFFSLNEDELTIQSTYFYLSKSGSRVRKMIFPNTVEDIEKNFDVIVTTNKEIIDKLHNKKYIILIEKNDNLKLKSKADKSYKNLIEILNDKLFVSDIRNNIEKGNTITKIIKYIKDKWLKMF